MMGIIRVVSLKLTGYSYSYSEYGISWNFFFTIFFVKMICVPIEILIINKSPIRALIIGNTIGIIYQYFLSEQKLTFFLIDDNLNRSNDFITANKEGIFSSIGYISIYLQGEAVCLYLMNIINSNGEESLQNFARSKYSNTNLLLRFKIILRVTHRIFIISLIYWILLEFNRSNVQNISRRMGNLTFIYFIVIIIIFSTFNDIYIIYIFVFC
jgi:glucosaminylphosphatidylinositol acyltransferase